MSPGARRETSPGIPGLSSSGIPGLSILGIDSPGIPGLSSILPPVPVPATPQGHHRRPSDSQSKPVFTVPSPRHDSLMPQTTMPNFERATASGSPPAAVSDVSSPVEARIFSPATPPDEPQHTSPRTATHDGHNRSPYLALRPESFISVEEPDEDVLQPPRNLFPMDDSAFWRGTHTKAFVKSLKSSVKWVRENPENVIRAGIKEVILINRESVPPQPARQDEDEDMDLDTEALVAKHQTLVPFLRQRMAGPSVNERRLEALRQEYVRRHQQWLQRCRVLDAQKAKPVVYNLPDLPVTNTRSTRRHPVASTFGDAVRTDFEFEQIMNSLENEDMTDPNQLYLRNQATVPDLVTLQPDFVQYQFDDTNGLVDGDPRAFFDRPEDELEHWTPEERETFKTNFAKYPKQFGAIAEALPNKTSHDCVIFYYLTKKDEIDYRDVLATYGSRRRGRRKLGKGGALLADIQTAAKSKGASSKTVPQPTPPLETTLAPTRSTAVSARAAAPQAPPLANSTRGLGRPRAAASRPVIIDSSSSSEEDSDSPPAKKPGRPRGSTSAKTSKPPSTSATTATGTPTDGRRKPVSRRTTGMGEESVKASYYWRVNEKATFLELLGKHGKDFEAIAKAMPSKTATQIANYHSANSEKLGLEKLARAD